MLPAKNRGVSVADRVSSMRGNQNKLLSERGITLVADRTESPPMLTTKRALYEERTKAIQDANHLKGRLSLTTKQSRPTLADVRRRHSSLLSAQMDPLSATRFKADEPLVHVEEDTITASFASTLSITPSRIQGTPPEENNGPEYYNADRYFSDRNRFSHILPSSLLASFNALLQTLFYEGSQSSSAAALTGSNLLRHQILKETRKSDGGVPISKLASKQPSALGNPTDIRTVYNIFDNLDPKTTTFATCPDLSCCSIYSAAYTGENDTPIYPPRCTNVKYGMPCNKPLTNDFRVANGLAVPKPIKPYVYNHFNDHVAALLSRPGVEDAIELYMEASDGGESAFDDELKDIMSADEIRKFKDSTGQPFVRKCGTELRLVWAIAADWYNPHTNKASGKAASSGVVAMFCLSLHPEIRYLEEYVYVCGIIPGPNEPALDAINPFITPLMHDLNSAFDPGTYYSRTYNHPKGRLCLSAVIPLIADTLASKKIGGNISHGSKFFCSRCRLPRTQIENLDYANWPAGLSRNEHIAHAEEWKAADSFKEQESLARKNGVRWSALLLLPYWQPSSWTVTEALHVLLLGVIPRHCRDLLGLNLSDLPMDESESEDRPAPSKASMNRARSALSKGLPGQLQKASISVLKALCEEEHTFVPLRKKGRRKKKDYINALLKASTVSTEERPNLGLDSNENIGLLSLLDGIYPASDSPVLANDSPSLTRNASASHDTDGIGLGPVITQQMLIKIREHIKSTIRPAWQASLPEKFGQPEHGKLKADQWRTALEFDIPISLVQILASQKPSGNVEADARLQKLATHTLDLAMALAWGLSRRTSKRHADNYTRHMARYIAGIQDLYPEYKLKPIHHYALHIQDILARFGPLHGTWGFALERLIGALQKLNTNSKPGEMEATALYTFCRRSNVMRWVVSDGCPPILQSAWKHFCQKRGLRDLASGQLQDASFRSPLPLSPHHRITNVCSHPSHEALSAAIKSKFVEQYKPAVSTESKLYYNIESIENFHSFTRGSVQYTDYRMSEKHSLIYFYSNDTGPTKYPKGLHPAQIRHIFRHSHLLGPHHVVEVFVVIHCYIPVVLSKDPFAFFPDFRAAIFESEPSSIFRIIKASQVHCHANLRPWDASLVVMRAVDREY